MDGQPDLLAFTWCGRERRNFTAACSNLRAAEPVFRQRWRQVEDVASQADPERVSMSIPIPHAARLHCNSCAKIDHHNRKRQDDLKVEKKLGTHDWSKRVNLSVQSMIVVDACLACIGCTESHLPQDRKTSF